MSVHDEQPSSYDEMLDAWRDDSEHEAARRTPTDSTDYAALSPAPRAHPSRVMPIGTWKEKAAQYEDMAAQVDAADYDSGRTSTIELSTMYLTLATLCRLKK